MLGPGPLSQGALVGHHQKLQPVSRKTEKVMDACGSQFQKAGIHNKTAVVLKKAENPGVEKKQPNCKTPKKHCRDKNECICRSTSFRDNDHVQKKDIQNDQNRQSRNDKISKTGKALLLLRT